MTLEFRSVEYLIVSKAIPHTVAVLTNNITVTTPRTPHGKPELVRAVFLAEWVPLLFTSRDVHPLRLQPRTRQTIYSRPSVLWADLFS